MVTSTLFVFTPAIHTSTPAAREFLAQNDLPQIYAYFTTPPHTTHQALCAGNGAGRMARARVRSTAPHARVSTCFGTAMGCCGVPRSLMLCLFSRHKPAATEWLKGAKFELI